MKILAPTIYGYERKLSFNTGGKTPFDVEIKYTGTPNCTKGTVLDNEIIPTLASSVNAHDDLVLMLRSAIERVKIANNSGNPILSAWCVDAEELLARVTGD